MLSFDTEIDFSPPIITAFLPNYSIGIDAYKNIEEICINYGKIRFLIFIIFILNYDFIIILYICKLSK